MLLWTICALCSLLGLREFAGSAGAAFSVTGRERANLRSVYSLLQELEETLLAGLVPASDRWARLTALPEPWGSLAHESLDDLRSCGAALLPTLKRLRTLAQDHEKALSEARARSSQALAQAVVCAMLVPLFGGSLYELLPGIEQRSLTWFLACVISAAMAGTGALWMLAIADRARWAGLSVSQRPWILASQCAGERFLALLRAGNPADLAWVRACELLKREAPGLAERWGASVWSDSEPLPERRSGATQVLEEAGGGLRKAVQVSLMEGRPCTERAETALGALRVELRMQVERELGLLATRALKPLFGCVAPALLLLLAFGLWLSWEQSGAGRGF